MNHHSLLLHSSVSSCCNEGFKNRNLNGRGIYTLLYNFGGFSPESADFLVLGPVIWQSIMKGTPFVLAISASCEEIPDRDN